MSECDDICKQFPSITLEDALTKKEMEDGTQAPVEDALKKKQEVEDGNQAQLDDTCRKLKLKRKMMKKKNKIMKHDGTQALVADPLKEMDDTCIKLLKEEVEDGLRKSLKLKKKKKKMKAKKHDEVEDEEWRKYLGVLKSAGMFSASIRNPGGSRVWLGTYKSPKVAALAYDHATYKLHGSQATLNFPHLIRTARL